MSEHQRLVRLASQEPDLPAEEICRQIETNLAVIRRQRRPDAVTDEYRSAGSSLNTIHRLPYWLTR